MSPKNVKADDILYQGEYNSPFGKIYLTSDGKFLTSLSFKKVIGEFSGPNALPIFAETCRWLNIYFSGLEPNFLPPIQKFGETPFQTEVIEELLKIPFGKIITYGDIAKNIAKKHNIAKMSAQAVGGAIGRNKIAIIIPCHRVVGSNKSLTGYNGGLDIKEKILTFEGHKIITSPDKRIAL